MKVAAYCRVSTEKEDQLNSLEAQKEFFAAYTRRTGDSLVRLYADEGISGTKIKNRKQFLLMMSDAEKGLFELLVVKDISRFARNTVDLLQSIRRLKFLGIETQFLTANMTSIGNSEFVLTIFGALAQEESANISKRVKFGKRVNAEKGRVPNMVYGYDKTVGEYFDMKINENEAEVVRKIFRLYTDEGYGTVKISEILNAEGLRTKRNCKWSSVSVCRILSNELYTGKIVNCKQEIADFLTGRRRDRDRSEWLIKARPDLKIIEQDIFTETLRIREERGKTFRLDKKRNSNRRLFSTLIKCRDCGWSFRRTERTYKNTYVRWVCSGRNGRGADSCPNRTYVDESEMVGVLNGYFSGILAGRRDVIGYAVAELAKRYAEGYGCVSDTESIRSEISRLRNSRKKYMDMYSDDLITREELNEKIGGMRSRIERLEDKIKISAGGADMRARFERLLKDAFGSVDKFADVSRLNNAGLKKIISKIEVGGGNVDIFIKDVSNRANCVQLSDCRT